MAKDGKKLELFEILAAKRANGKMPLGLDAKPARQANAPDGDVPDAPGMIIDDAVSAEMENAPPRERDARERESAASGMAAAASGAADSAVDSGIRSGEDRERGEPPESVSEPARERDTTRTISPRAHARPARHAETRHAGARHAEEEKPDSRSFRSDPSPHRAVPESAEPAEPPRPKSPRELVFALDTGLIAFTVVMMLVACAYFIGYKRGQEERPAGIAGAAEIEAVDPSRVNIRNLAPPPRAAVRPPEQDFTLIIRKEPAANELPERLELELAEALMRGGREAGRELPGFIFRTSGADPQYILAVGLGPTANDQELSRLLKIYNDMEGIALSSQERPYLGCRIAPVRELGVPVY